MWYQCNTVVKEFLSTLSLRRATFVDSSLLKASKFLSTLSLRRATFSVPFKPASHLSISIHALLAESDSSYRSTRTRNVSFLSTLALRRATALGANSPISLHISIHALLAESDSLQFTVTVDRFVFLLAESDVGGRVLFGTPGHISIHALLAESDIFQAWLTGNISNFYPRSPCGERLFDDLKVPDSVSISIHALLAESDNIARAADGVL